jgi:valyl-tRNA synthetase
MIDKTYQPSAVEGRIYAMWEQTGAFRAGRSERRGAEPYTIVIPPPNVTGSLHMGHALNNTLQDVLCRFERMRGRDVLWQPGTDHAGIATQMVVERQLMERQEHRRALGREKFLEKVWAWKAESGSTIINQLKRLGASCDWSRERFTMDEGLSRAVVKVFVDLHAADLIYKAKRLVNWDPKLLTAISDLEIVQVEHRGSFNWSRDSGEPLNSSLLGKVLSRDPNGHLYYIDYPLLIQGDGKWIETGESITVATTRPETMLGDVAVAVHPESDLWRRHKGKCARLPLVLNHPIYSNLIPVIPDEYADPEKGTGAVKITPAHDFSDYDVWLRHSSKGQELEGVEPIEIFTREARLKSSPSEDFEGSKSARWPNSPEHAERRSDAVDRALGGLSVADLIPKELRGRPRFDARKLVVEMLAQQSPCLLVKIEPHTHMVPHGDRSGDEIEPFLTEQWYVDAKTLAQPAIEAVRSDTTVFVPKNWEKTYFDWMANIQPWCISRQLWWGHQIPAWYGPEGKAFVAPTKTEAIELAAAYYEQKGPHQAGLFDLDGADYAAGLREGRYKLSDQDEDVLDTWFSSALWPFSTLGWPDKTPELERYYPTDVLVTGFDIIFFWVARMMMMGLHFMPKVPFRTVYIHALVRDAQGAKMSKSKGNVIDPLHLIDDYGADALRFTLAAMAAQGRDIKLSSQRVEGSRNFVTKLWNAARFAEMNGCATAADFNPTLANETINRWIAHETSGAAADITTALDAYKFNEAATAAYRFVWNIYCDWYLELAKPLLLGPDGDAKRETQAMVAWVRDQILKLLHPFMPFVTEELWAVTARPRRQQLLALTEWPSGPGAFDARAEAEIGWVIEVITAIRSVRAEMNVSVPLPLVFAGASNQIWARSQRWSEFLMRMAKISEIVRAPSYSPGTIQLVVRGETIGLALAGLVDISAERARLQKELGRVDADIARIDAKLANPDFVARAPEEVVDGEREKREELVQRRAKNAEALERLKGVQ